MEVTTSDIDVIAHVKSTDLYTDANEFYSDVSDRGVSEASSEFDEGSEEDDKEIVATEVGLHTKRVDGEAGSGFSNGYTKFASSIDKNTHNTVEQNVDTTHSLVRSALPSNKSFDRQVKALITSSESYIYFDQWKYKLNDRSTVTRLRLAFEQLLPRVSGDVAGVG